MKITLILLAFGLLSCQTKKDNQNLKEKITVNKKDVVSEKNDSINSTNKVLKINYFRMKYILSILAILLVTFSMFPDTFSATNSLFNNSTNEIPYCNGEPCWVKAWIDAIKNIDWLESNRTASVYIQGIVKYVLWFLALIATIMIIYAWFNLLTWVGDEEAAKKSKTIILYSVIWIVIIFLAGPIVEFVLNALK